MDRRQSVSPQRELYLYGSHLGEFVGLNRKADGNYEIRWRETGARQRTIYATMAPACATPSCAPTTTTRRTRAGFAEATQRGTLTWSSVYVDFTTRALTVTLAKPVFHQQRTQRGVVATDIPLTALTEFVRGLQVSRTGVAFIVERDGTLIATSTPEALFGDNPGSLCLRASESANPLVRQAWGATPQRCRARPQRGAWRRDCLPLFRRQQRPRAYGAPPPSATAPDWTDNGRRSAAIRSHGQRSAPSAKRRHRVWQPLGLPSRSDSGSCTASPATYGGCRRRPDCSSRGQSPERLFKGRSDELCHRTGDGGLQGMAC